MPLISDVGFIEFINYLVQIKDRVTETLFISLIATTALVLLLIYLDRKNK